MDKKTLPLLLIGGVAAGWYFLSRGNAAQNLKIMFQTLKVGKMNGMNLPPIELTFKIINPTSTPLSVQSILGDLFVNGKIISTISQTLPVTIPANNVTFYTIKLETGIMQVVFALLQIIKDGKPFTAEFKGAANSSGFMIPLNQKIYQ